MNVTNLKNILQETLDEILLERKTKGAFIAPKHKGMILLMRRSKDGSWGLPGGRLEKKEDVLTGAKRETAEETNMIFPKKNLSKIAKVRGRNKNIHLFTTKAIKKLPYFEMNQEHFDAGFFKIKDLKDIIRKNTKKISIRDEKGNPVETIKRKHFKLHKPAKLFVLNY